MSFEKQLATKFGNQWGKHRRRNGQMEYRANCPFCLRERGTPDKKRKLYMNPSKGVFNCYRCSSSGPLRKIFRDYIPGAKPEFAPVIQQQTKDCPMPGDVIPLHHLDDDHIARRYLEYRGFKPDVLSEHLGVHYCSKGRRFGNGEDFFFDTTNTILFPVWMHGKLIGWQARLLYDPDKLDDKQCELYQFPKNSEGEWVRPPKYYTPYGMSKGDILYNFDNARQFPLVVVSEGPLDVAGIGVCGVATFGKSISETQGRLIKQYWRTAILMLDPDDADNETMRLCYDLQMSIPVIPVKLQGVKDPGDASFERIWTQIYDAAAARGHHLSLQDIGPFNRAIARTKDSIN